MDKPGGPEMDGPIERQRHYFYLVHLMAPAPDTWHHVLTIPGFEKGLCFSCAWVPVERRLSIRFNFGCEGGLDKYV